MVKSLVGESRLWRINVLMETKPVSIPNKPGVYAGATSEANICKGVNFANQQGYRGTCQRDIKDNWSAIYKEIAADRPALLTIASQPGITAKLDHSVAVQGAYQRVRMRFGMLWRWS